MDKYQFIIQLIQFVVPPTTTLLAGYFGIRHGISQIKEQKKIEIIQEQLSKFYSPLLGLHKEIRAKSEVRLKIKEAGDKVWERKVHEQSADVEKVHQEINYNNAQFKDEIFPLYKKMLDIFRENYWLAEPETKMFYPQFLEFVEIWNRHFKNSIDRDIVKEIGHTEENVKPFYKELETRMEILRGSIKK